MIDVQASRRSCAFAAPAVAAGLAVLLGGCGGGDDRDTATVHGKVTYNGAPLPGGGVTFVPVSGEGATTGGKPAAGTINPDGTYTLTTYEDGDGAVIGKHHVGVSPPPPPGAGAEAPEGTHAAPTPPSPFAGLKPTTEEVEVKAGDNEINIELTK